MSKTTPSRTAEVRSTFINVTRSSLTRDKSMSFIGHSTKMAFTKSASAKHTPVTSDLANLLPASLAPRNPSG